jgi:hypothetical protein
MREKTGGAAFPTPRFMVDDESRILGFSIHTDGMSLRDYFAARAMQPIKSQAVDYAKAEASDMARKAYMMADAMLKAREE